ncbi:MAG: DNA (cytosine-5-)-methyltransferase [Myxococcota bacterium]
MYHPTPTDIRSARLAARVKQADLARAVGASAHALRKWERGLEAPPHHVLAAIARHLDVDPALLAEGQAALAAVPGEGYTTATAGEGQVTPRRREPPVARRVLDLFCGAGGLSFGFEATGEFVTTAGIDLLPDRVATFTTNHAHAAGVAGDLRRFPIDRLHALAGEVDVVVGGPPCQGFSSIRPFRTLTEGDARNSLGEHYALTIARLRPRWFVFENVVGLLTHEGGARLARLIEALAGAGYAVDWRVLNAATFGVPQSRERVVLVGNRVGARFRWPDPSHRHDHRSMAGARAEVVRASPDLPPAVTVADAIGDLPPVDAGREVTAYADPPTTPYQRHMREGSPALTLHRATTHSARMMEIVRLAGASIAALPPGMVTSGFSSCYSRLAGDRPSTTLTVNFVHPASNRCIHPVQHRALTPREGARLQSFPDRYVFRGNGAQVVKQIGNAVPPLLGEVLARAILASDRV